MTRTDIPSKTLRTAVDAIGDLPGIGGRSAMRLALHLLRQPKDKVISLAQAISALAVQTRYCRECGSPCDGELCEVCANPKRDPRQICVVESIRDRMSIEATGTFRGTYHLLGGIISPIDGVAPSDLRIDELLRRVDTLQKESLDPVEVIFALSGSVEGETTALYLHRRLEPFKVKTTTLARGLSFGADLEYADVVTLGRAIASRIPFTVH